MTRKILVLHGDRQTGDLLVSRIASLKRKLLKDRSSENPKQKKKESPSSTNQDYKIELVGVDGPFQWEIDPSVHVTKTITEEEQRENELMRTWWRRDENRYDGLEESLDLLMSVWNGDEGFEGIIGFSRGARLTHLCAALYELSKGKIFPNLKYVIMASGYGHVPMPSNFPPQRGHWDELLVGAEYDDNSLFPLSIPSLHIMGSRDRLITVEYSRALLPSYCNPQVHEHDGGHHLPQRAADNRAILSFIDSTIEKLKETPFTLNDIEEQDKIIEEAPDEEHAQTQIEEVTSLALIFPDEFKLLSDTDGHIVDEYGEEQIQYKFPISYAIQINPDDVDDESKKLWPVKDIALKVEYGREYPDVIPKFSLYHYMNLLEFKLSQEKACLDAVKEVAEAEIGMPSVMSCVYGAREFFENGGLAASLNHKNLMEEEQKVVEEIDHVSGDDDTDIGDDRASSLLRKSNKERIKRCIEQGLDIANSILGRKDLTSGAHTSEIVANSGKGGSWKYTIGLVGKPSAGKSTFFNAGTAFARQRGGDYTNEDGIAIGGASMAPHPFTTIDPNVGYCLVPAPSGSCPEDETSNAMDVACTHGRDTFGRRLIPVTLKDVAGLVPGAYQGRGKGNKFLDDLTDADVLIHVLDASGSADSEGNKIINDSEQKDGKGTKNPLDDIDWIFNELVMWVFMNVSSKWDGVAKNAKGREKLARLFSGYKQSQAFVHDVFFAVEKYLDRHEDRSKAFEHLELWDEGDLFLLVSAFLGSRFPVALAMNKMDISSAKIYCKQILDSLPNHGAQTGIPLCAHEEMKFMKKHIYEVIAPKLLSSKNSNQDKVCAPKGVWNCLNSAIQLRPPVLVFPVSDMETLQPLSSMTEYGISSASLPSPGMIACLKAAGGKAPTFWNEDIQAYDANKNTGKNCALRDVLVLKPGSTVEDAFISLKNIGILGGEFVRAEAIANVGDNSKLVKKDDILGRHNRIIRIWTTKRREWQKRM